MSAGRLQLGNKAPNFKAQTTKGEIDFHSYIGENWAILFCYPDDFAPVATTELVMLAQLQEEFSKRKVKLLTMSTKNNPNQNGDYTSHEQWAKDVGEISGAPLTCPIIVDSDGKVSKLYNILDEGDVHDLNKNDDVSEGAGFKRRTVLIIGPNKKIWLNLNYPYEVGLNTAEILRTVDCLQTTSRTRTLTPANWVPGSDVLVDPKLTDEEAKAKHGDLTVLKPYVRFTKLPVEETSVSDI